MAKCLCLVDDEDRENEGDLIIPASQKLTPKLINFMAKHGRGLNMFSFISNSSK